MTHARDVAARLALGLGIIDNPAKASPLNRAAPFVEHANKWNSERPSIDSDFTYGRSPK